MLEILGAAWSWSEAHRWVVWAVAAGSLASLALSAVLVSVVLIQLPPDHYSRPRLTRLASSSEGLAPFLMGGAALVVRNVLGWIFVLAGVAMLVLPGQGLLSILAGLVLIDFPGKHRFERRLLRSPGVRRAMNWLRRRSGRPPFDFT